MYTILITISTCIQFELQFKIYTRIQFELQFKHAYNSNRRNLGNISRSLDLGRKKRSNSDQDCFIGEL